MLLLNKIAFATSRNELREIALNMRRLAKIKPGEPFPVVRILEEYLDYQNYEFEIISDDIANDIMGNAYAETIPSLKLLRVRESVYENAVRGIPRDRFTLAHELCHLIFHDELTVSFARNEAPVPKYMDPEWQANTFAAEILAPANELGPLTIEEICNNYLVSKKVAQIQSSYIYNAS